VQGLGAGRTEAVQWPGTDRMEWCSGLGAAGGRVRPATGRAKLGTGAVEGRGARWVWRPADGGAQWARQLDGGRGGWWRSSVAITMNDAAEGEAGRGIFMWKEEADGWWVAALGDGEGEQQ
jgi:hypothetical protein